MSDPPERVAPAHEKGRGQPVDQGLEAQRASRSPRLRQRGDHLADLDEASEAERGRKRQRDIPVRKMKADSLAGLVNMAARLGRGV
jgi:hypothetical protein